MTSLLQKTQLSWLAPLIALALTTVFGAGSAQAAFPGTPGPIVYSQVTYDEAGATGGLFAHGPRVRQRPRQLTDGYEDSAPSYSSNGRKIAFAGNRGAGIGPPHIYVMNADGSGVRALTRGGVSDSNPSFSPDGRRVVFDRQSGEGRRSQIFVVNIDGSGLRQLTRGSSSNYDPVFAPNGRWIAFVSDRDRDARTDRSDIFSMRPSGRRQRVLIDGPRSESEPDISPNGRRVVFSSNRRGGPNIFVAKANGRRVHALTRSKSSCFRGACYTSPAWAPDGRHIAFLSAIPYHTGLEVMRSNGKQRKSFAGGGIEAEGFGVELGAPTWGPRPR